MRYLPLQCSLIWHSYLLIAFCGVLAARLPLPAGLASLLLLGLDRRLWLWSRLSLALILFGLGWAWAGWQFYQASAALESPPQWVKGARQRLCGQILRVQGLPNGRLRVILKDTRPETGGEALPGLCAWTWEKPAFQPLAGQGICITRAVKPVHGFANAADNGYEAYNFSRNLFWRIWSRDKSGDPVLSGAPAWGASLRQDWENKFLAILHGGGAEGQLSQAQAILPALLFGDRFYLNQETIDFFARGALAHSLALSGQHLAIAGYAGWLFIIACALFWPRVYLWRPRILLIALASVPVALGYLWLGDAPPSLQRASAMLIFACIFLWRRVAFDGVDLLALALFAILIFNPLAAFNMGLQLSILCVAAILVAWPAVVKLAPYPEKRRSRIKTIFWRLCQICLVSLLIQLALLPLQLMLFQQAGLYFAMNVLWLPLLGLVTLPAAFIALVLCAIPLEFCQLMAGYAATLATWPCAMLLALLQCLHEAELLIEPAFLSPHWSALLAYALLGCGLAWLFAGSGMRRNARKLLILSLLLLALGPLLRLLQNCQGNLVMEALDVGQGQAILVTAPSGQRLLVDGGGSFFKNFDPGRTVVAPHISHNQGPELAAVLNTHPDMDHLGGLFYILGRMPGAKIYHNGREAQGEARVKWLNLRGKGEAAALVAGDEILIGDGHLRLEVLHPPGPGDSRESAWQGNGASLVLRLVQNGKGLVLFTGDVTAEAQKYILAQGRNLEAQVVMAPHHGSGRDMVPAFYRAARPELIIACCGYDNRWGYPAQKLRRWLERGNIPLLDTGNCGKISVVWRADGRRILSTIRDCGTI